MRTGAQDDHLLDLRAVQWMFEVVPLYHAVALVRALTTGQVDASTPGHALFLLVTGTGALVIAMRRLERTLVS